MIDLTDYVLEHTKVDLIEMRQHKRKAFSISVKDGKIERLSRGLNRGACVRTLVDGSWGFSSTTNLGRRSLLSITKNAESLARTSKAKKRRVVELANTEAHTDTYETSVRKDPKEEDMSFLIELALEADKRVRDYSEDVVSDTINLSVIDDELFFASSEGSRITQRIVRCFGSAFVIAKSDGQIVSTHEGIGRQAGLEVFDDNSLLDAALKAGERAIQIAPRKVVSGGHYEVVLEDKIVGLLAHEAVGHCAEADLVYGGSFLADRIDKKVASDLITLVDDGRFPHGFGTMKYDDEGTPTEETVIIEKGEAKRFLHSRETARHFNVGPTGNARAWSFDYDPIIRMRNTYIQPGDQTLDELIEGVRDGYFLKGGGNGQADFNGEFTFGIQEAIRISNGKLKETYRGATIGGNAFEVLGKVSGVGKDFSMRVGLCGKEQMNYVGIGGPSIRTQILIGGV